MPNERPAGGGVSVDGDRFARTFNAALAGHYVIERELGRGGNATVYLARDQRHPRHVAIKIIHHDLSRTLGTERFLREIQIAADLQHPHILGLHDSGEVDGSPYYVMPYVDGESLRARLERARQLPIDEALRIAREVASALDYAHRRGVVHRDVKPENILIEDGHAVLADFGIARAIGTTATGPRTATGTSVGTPAYMSPEQAAGDRDIDGRSDIYALGCVLYEMLAGEPPFTGPTAESVIRQHLVAPAPRIANIRTAVPGRVDAAIARALAKTPADRFATANQFADAIAGSRMGADVIDAQDVPWWRIGRRRSRYAAMTLGIALLTVVAVVAWRSRPNGSPRDPNVIAVLPFRVAAPDSSHNYLREGVVDLINARLTGKGLPRAVDTRTMLSAWRRASRIGQVQLTEKEAIAVADRLGAGRLLLGEFVATRGQMTASARLLRVPDGRVLGEHAEQAVGDELILVNRLVGRILALSAGEAPSRLAGLSDSVGAVRAYLEAMRAYREGHYAKSREHFDRSLEIDSTFAPAALWRIYANTMRSPPPKIVEASRHAWSLLDRYSRRDSAVVAASWSIGPNYPEPSTGRELIAAAEAAARANPDRAEAWYWWGGHVLIYGAYSSIPNWRHIAVAALDSAVKLDSTSGPAVEIRLWAALEMNDTDAIAKLAGLYLNANPDAELANLYRWAAARASKDPSALTAVRAQMPSMSGANLALMGQLSVVQGTSLRDADSATEASLAIVGSEPAPQIQRQRILYRNAAVRGRVQYALSLADSAPIQPSLVITVAMADSGYSAAAFKAERALDALADTAPGREAKADAICHAELWRASRGDTTRTPGAVNQLREIQRTLDIGLFPRVGRLEVCPLLLEALLEAARPASASAPALDRLDALMRQGTGLEIPGSLANFMIIGWRERRGEYLSALAAARRRLGMMQVANFTVVVPAQLRAEGRLAAVLGDTAGAIRAYEQYLALRDLPDAGPMQAEVQGVRRHLAELTKAAVRR